MDATACRPLSPRHELLVTIILAVVGLSRIFVLITTGLHIIESTRQLQRAETKHDAMPEVDEHAPYTRWEGEEGPADAS